MYHEVEVSSLVIESYALGTWEACTYLEQLLGNAFLSVLELVSDANWLIIVFFNLEGCDLEVR